MTSAVAMAGTVARAPDRADHYIDSALTPAAGRAILREACCDLRVAGSG